MGVVVGGWSYVAAVYGLTFSLLIAFFLWVSLRRRAYLRALERLEEDRSRLGEPPGRERSS